MFTKRFTARTAAILSVIVVSFYFCSAIWANAASRDERDQLQREVQSLSKDVESLDSECQAIDSRLDATSKLIAEDCNELEETESKWSSKQEKFNARLRHIYRNDDIGMLEVLLNIRDFEDLMVRVSYIQKINESDAKLIRTYRAKQEKISNLRNDLEKNKKDELSLKNLKVERLTQLKNKLAEKRRLFSEADAELQQQIKVVEQQNEKQKKVKRQAMAAQSAPLGSQVGTVRCNVVPYLGDVCFTTQRMPSNYSATGVTFSGVASWYGDEFNGRPTASGEIFNENDFTCASKTLAFGTYLFVTYGNRHVVVKVTDRGPFVKGRILDLSKAAAKALGISGIGMVKAEIIKPQ